MLKKRLKQSAIATILAVLAMAYGFVALINLRMMQVSWANNAKLRDYHAEFQKLQHNTPLIAARRGVFRPTGSGRNCFYFVGEVRQSPEEASSVEAFYDAQLRGLHVEFLQQEEFGKNVGTSVEVPYGFHQPEQWGINLETIESPDHLFVLFWINYTLDEKLSLDWRCR